MYRELSVLDVILNNNNAIELKAVIENRVFCYLLKIATFFKNEIRISHFFMMTVFIEPPDNSILFLSVINLQELIVINKIF